ncbi:hypothetical protein LEN26_000521 [Aphanomyces euteiches]|nr:hypothetical protein AeMF1_016056 [Aphanomyces euteiches]KAH9163421.1 hypothetical protein LEN26_000521 [Aphanomyces euteiches]KAH9191901.1 hypothetical protein AeNC1_006126 [Aphanomyces euteiches]
MIVFTAVTVLSLKSSDLASEDVAMSHWRTTISENQNHAGPNKFSGQNYFIEPELIGGPGPNRGGVESTVGRLCRENALDRRRRRLFLQHRDLEIKLPGAPELLDETLSPLCHCALDYLVAVLQTAAHFSGTGARLASTDDFLDFCRGGQLAQSSGYCQRGQGVETLPQRYALAVVKKRLHEAADAELTLKFETEELPRLMRSIRALDANRAVVVLRLERCEEALVGGKAVDLSPRGSLPKERVDERRCRQSHGLWQSQSVA